MHRQSIPQPEAQMIRRRRMIAGVALLLVVLGFAWHRDSSEGSAPAFTNLVFETPYVIETNSGVSTFDLQFDSNQRYLLIVGSLGEGDRAYSVSLNAQPISAQPISTVQRQPLARVAPLDARQIPRRIASEISPIVSATNQAPQESRDFFIHVTDTALENPRAYHCVRSRLIAEGKGIRVYLDSDQQESELSNGLAEELVRLFDEDIQPTSRRDLGSHLDVDGDGKFAILLTHWLGKLQGGRTTVGGFVRGSDFDTGIARPFSNCADVMYLNSNLKPGPALKTLLAHEYTHAILFSARYAAKQGLSGANCEEDWLNEAIAHVAENLQSNDWSNLDHRIHAFTKDSGNCPLVIPDYYRTGRWRDHGCRGATYLFLRWCVDTHGEGLLHKLIHSRSSGAQNLERATGTPFAELFRHWTIALSRFTETIDSRHRMTPAGLRYLSLQELIGAYDLRGIDRDEWIVSSSSREITLSGTTARYVELHATQASAVYRISISAERAAQLQLTLFKLSPKPAPRQVPTLALR